MSGLELITGNEKLSILQCEELAKDVAYDSLTFDLCGPTGKLPCQWVDAYFGFFKIIGREGVMMARDLKYASDIWCENVGLASEEGGAHS